MLKTVLIVPAQLAYNLSYMGLDQKGRTGLWLDETAVRMAGEGQIMFVYKVSHKC